VAFFLAIFDGMQRRYSFIIPVFNRPQEIQELLESFAQAHWKLPFEIVIVEDGSSETSEAVIQQFSKQLPITYFYKSNSGPGDSRNFGMKRASGNYFIILDSDILMPKTYLPTVDRFLEDQYVDCYGGADAAHQSFSPLQKAINFVMTSFLTTGGIRGKKQRVNSFEPRSFNMGISKKAFEATGGFGTIHPGEDPDLSQRIKANGFTTAFIPNAAVYHKRRISWKKFYTQVRKFGLVRPILNSWHPKSAKITYWFPTCFILFVIASIGLGIFVNWIFLIPLLFYILLVFLWSSLQNRSMYIGGLSVVALFIQFFGYGNAFFWSTWHIIWRKKDPKTQFPHLFFE
tara:strand:- start:12263 stop:13294 length:1032 start_codon:yes stop_codon:yes gene_type:complete